MSRAALTVIKHAAMLARIGWVARKARASSGETERLLAQRALAGLFADARGITMKVGQLFAGAAGETPLRELVTAGIQPRPLREMLAVLEADLGRSAKAIFAVIDEARAAASLGQVHRAVLKSGGGVAVKIRYPDIAAAVDAELRLAGLLPGVGPVKRWGFDLEAYKRTLRNNMRRELDYRSEAERQRRFAIAVQTPGLRVPEVHLELCGERVLVQSWESGVPLDQVIGWPKRDRLLIGRTLLLALFKSLFVAGEVHGDPNPGNYFYRRGDDGQPEVVLLDFGCTVPVSEPRRLALLKLLLACREGMDVAPLQCFAALGFDPGKLSHLNETLPALCRVLFRPFLVDGAFHPADWHLKRDITALLGEHRWWFRSAGPADLLLLMRAFQGLAAQLGRLDAGLPWWPLLEQAVGAELMQRARAWTLPELPPELASGAVSIRAIARRLCVSVTEGNVPRVSLSMPAEAALDLENIIPEDVLERIRASGVAIGAIVNRVRASSIAPQELFVLDEGPKRHRVWLE
ncbi:MAG: AarF/UbiB family protein [Candidatus Contendobacter sp.]|nr:AarF/UbiB family protein [Candidatus Contendobacter sp.]MDG4557085.1 AarF/UbiB family protein [Candidatus Contendobacter sp.]